MKILFPLSALALILSLTPASAMCGGMGKQADGSSQAQGGMCGRSAQPSQADDPFGLKQSKPQPQQQQSGVGMCPCCRGMAMMGDGMKMNSDDPHKGMDMTPKQ